MRKKTYIIISNRIHSCKKDETKQWIQDTRDHLYHNAPSFTKLYSIKVKYVLLSISIIHQHDVTFQFVEAIRN